MNAQGFKVKRGRRTFVKLELTPDLVDKLIEDLDLLEDAKPRWKMLNAALHEARESSPIKEVTS